MDQVPVFCEIRADQAKLEQYAKEVAEKVKASFGLPFAHDAERQQPSILDDDPMVGATSAESLQPLR